MFVVETHPFSTIGTRSHRAEHRQAARDLRIELGRRPTTEEYAVVRQHVAAERRAVQQRTRALDGTSRALRQQPYRPARVPGQITALARYFGR